MNFLLSLWKVNQTICFVSQYCVDYHETQVIKLVTFAPLLVAKCFYIRLGKGKQFMKPWEFAIYPNHTSGSLVHKRKTIKFDVQGEWPATKYMYIQISWT